MEKHTLTKGNVSKGILLFVLPIIAGSLIQQLYVTIDAVVVGQFTGKLGLAAIDSVHTLFKFPLNFMKKTKIQKTKKQKRKKKMRILKMEKNQKVQMLNKTTMKGTKNING